MNGYPTKFIDNAMKTPRSVRQKIEYQSSVSLPYMNHIIQNRKDF